MEVPQSYASEIPTHSLAAILDELSDYAWGFDLEFDSSHYPLPHEYSLLSPPRPARAEHHATKRALIIASGSRAEFISRYMRAPDWIPVWDDGGKELPRGTQLTHVRGVLSEPKKAATVAIDVCAAQSIPASVEAYSVIIGFVDDEGDQHGRERAKFLDRINVETDTVVLLAPALPAQYPSEILSDTSRLPERVDAVIDTSLARSPATGRAQRSSDRRIADLVTEAALLTFHAQLAAEMKTLRGQGVVPIVAARVSKADTSRAGLADLHLASEATWAEVDLFRSSVGRRFSVYDLTRHERAPGKGVVELRSGATDFPDFAMSVVRRLASKATRGEWARSLRGISEELYRCLRFPQMSVMMTGPAARKDSTLLVLAEAPSVPALVEAERLDLQLVRYTDEHTLKRVIASGGRLRWVIPNEVRLQDIRPLAQNDGIVSRGADKRDILSISATDFEAWRKREDHLHASFGVRPLRSSIAELSREPSVFATPLEPLFALAGQGHLGALSLFAAARKTPAPRLGAFKRPGDLQRAWTQPPANFKRFVINDGKLPVVVSPLPEHELAAQTLFIVDGDWTVPALFQSAVFDVWARATRTQAEVWDARFSIRATFDTFPIPPELIDPQFHCISARRNTPVWKVLQREDKTLGDTPEPELLQRDVHNAVLRAYGLRSRSSEMEILERLVVLNRELRGGRPALI